MGKMKFGQKKESKDNMMAIQPSSKSEPQIIEVEKEVIVFKEVPIEKIVEVEKIVEIPVEKIVEIEKEVQMCKDMSFVDSKFEEINDLYEDIIYNQNNFSSSLTSLEQDVNIKINNQNDVMIEHRKALMALNYKIESMKTTNLVYLGIIITLTLINFFI